MKRSGYFPLAAVWMSLGTFAGAHSVRAMQAAPRMVLLNMSFYGRGANSIEPGDSGLAGQSGSLLRRELSRYQGLDLVDSSTVAAVVAREERNGDPCNTIACAVDVARQLNAKWVVTSKMSKASDLIWSMFGQLIEVSTGRILTDQEVELKGVSKVIAPQGAESLARRIAKAAGLGSGSSAQDSASAPTAAQLDVTQVRARLTASTEDKPADFSGMDLSRLDLHGVDFRRASLIKTRLASANLAGANLFTCDLTDAVLTGADLTGANLDGTILRRANFRDAKLAHASLFATIVEEADLSGADLSDTRIIGYLKKAKLTNAHLQGANIGADPGNQSMGVMRAAFVGADLSGADFSGANLFKVDFSYANLAGANLSHTNITNADLISTDFTGADLTGADLSKSDITGAIFTRARGVRQIKGLDQTRGRDKATFDEHME
ncbi:MAG: pentapeptide repeat-containing protein [Gemmatimonadota bacterium]